MFRKERINALNVEKANTRIAEQRAETAEAEARAGSRDQPAGLLAEHDGGAHGAGEVAGLVRVRRRRLV